MGELVHTLTNRRHLEPAVAYVVLLHKVIDTARA